MMPLKDESEKYWKEKLSPEQYKVLRQKGTEPAFTGDLVHNKDDGIYTCARCGQELFASKVKYDSGSGWPSFWEAIDDSKVVLEEDNSYGMQRIEVVCSNCDGHLGHVFNDGPEPTGQRYCINSAALNFAAEENSKS